MEIELPVMSRETCALLMIDFQRDFCEPGGYADRCGGVDWAEGAVEAAGQLLAAARRAGLAIVHTREGYAKDLADCHLQRRLRSEKAGAPIGAAGPLGRFLIRGEPGHDFTPALAPKPGERVLDKPSYGTFVTTDLEAWLRARGIVHLFFAGLTADVCVHTTLREAVDRGFFTYYVEDAISTFDAGLRAASAAMVDVEGGVWGERTTVASAVALFDELGARSTD